MNYYNLSQLHVHISTSLKFNVWRKKRKKRRKKDNHNSKTTAHGKYDYHQHDIFPSTHNGANSKYPLTESKMESWPHISRPAYMVTKELSTF